MPPQATSSYDEIPYINQAFPQTHPDRLATLAKLFGMTPPDLERCRVLELGCASGDNLIPMAAGLPNANFLGIDLSARQIEQGRRTIDALGLKNIELRHASITQVDASFGRFDYIVSHGVYSWVAESVREKILAISRENLAPTGVAYVSYNTLPGWHIRGMVRDMMIYHAGQFQDGQAIVQQARALLDFLAQSVPPSSPYGMMLRQELESIRPEADAYLAHDHLEEVNDPVYFHQFVKAAGRHGLQYLAEAEFSGMLVSNFPPQVAETLRRIATDLVRMEQLMDFVRNRTFRQTLLVHTDVAIRRNLDGRVLSGLHVASAARPASEKPVVTHGVEESFRTHVGPVVRTSNAITKAALLLLAGRWPLALPFEQLVAASRASLAGDQTTSPADDSRASDSEVLGNDLLKCYAAGLIELRARSPRFSVVASNAPVASPLARYQAERGTKVTNLRHEPVNLDGFSRRLLPLLDGTRTRQTLMPALEKMAANGLLEVRHEQTKELLAEGPTLRDVLGNALDQSLPRLARAALLLD